MQLIISAACIPPLLVREEYPLPQHSYFCQSCGAHREEFKPDECLYLYQHNALGKPVFVGFLCPNDFKLELATPTSELEVDGEANEIGQIKEEIKLCGECGLLPAANPETELCQDCINDFEEWRAMSLVEKLSPYTPALT